MAAKKGEAGRSAQDGLIEGPDLRPMRLLGLSRSRSRAYQGRVSMTDIFREIPKSLEGNDARSTKTLRGVLLLSIAIALLCVGVMYLFKRHITVRDFGAFLWSLAAVGGIAAAWVTVRMPHFLDRLMGEDGRDLREPDGSRNGDAPPLSEMPPAGNA